METIKVKIIKSSGEQYWYKNRIGDTFDVNKVFIGKGNYYALTDSALQEALRKLRIDGDEDAREGTIDGLTIDIEDTEIVTEGAN